VHNSGIPRGVVRELPPGFDDRPHRVQLVLSVDNMNAGVSGRESLNGAAEPGRASGFSAIAPILGESQQIATGRFSIPSIPSIPRVA
jgi:hypothetical protein